MRKLSILLILLPVSSFASEVNLEAIEATAGLLTTLAGILPAPYGVIAGILGIAIPAIGSFFFGKKKGIVKTATDIAISLDNDEKISNQEVVKAVLSARIGTEVSKVAQDALKRILR